MLRVKETKAIEAFSAKELEGYINDFIAKNRDKTIMDIKYDIYVRDIPLEFLDLEEEEGKTLENIFSALLLIGEEI